MAITAHQPSGQVVGRARELAEFDQTLDRVASGTPWAIELVGEPGIGKSRLLAELRGRARAHGFAVLDGRAAEFEHDIPFGVFLDALNDYAGSIDSVVLRGLESDVLEELGSIFPSLSAFAPDRPAGRAQAERYRVHYAIRAFLERLAKRQPLLLTVDDVHWADPASLEVMAHLLRRFNGPLLLAFAMRHVPVGLSGALEASARDGFGSRMDIGPLSQEDAHALLDPGLDTATREALLVESGGNPFYLEQLARAGDPRWVAPAGVRHAVDHELGRLVPPTRSMLEAAAVVGDSFDPALVAAVAQRDEADLLAALDVLLASDLIRPTAAPRTFRFRHPIVRRAVYDGMPAGSRVAAHARAASALAEGNASSAELAHHVALSAAPGDESAISLLIEAARAAAPRAPLTGGQWLLGAVRLLTGDDPERRARLLSEAAGMLTSGGGFAEALDALDEALALVPRDATQARAAMLAKRAEARRRGGRGFASPTELQSALAALPDSAVETAQALRIELAMNRYWHADFDQVRALAATVLGAARDRDDRLLVCLAASLSSLADIADRRMDDALAGLREAQAAFSTLADERIAERIYLGHYIGEAALRLERADDARAYVERCFEVARLTGQDATGGSWWGIVVQALLLKGDVREAARVGRDAVEMTPLVTDDWRMVWMLGIESMSAFWAGRHEQVFASASESMAGADRRHPETFLPLLGRLHLGAALVAAGDPAAALTELVPLDAEAAYWVLDLYAAYGWDLLIRAHLATRNIEAAGDTASRAELRADPTRLPQHAAIIRCAGAGVALARGDIPEAVAATEDAVELANRSGNPLTRARCQIAHGVSLAASGQVERAVAQLGLAEEMLWTCGATREADAAARELRRLGRRVTRRPRRDEEGILSELSPREQEVANEVAAGKTNRDIAATLFLSEKTIDSHLARIYAKLDVHSRAALTAIIARRRG
jgi:DNA-binding CsgD family transcriptional regulator